MCLDQSFRTIGEGYGYDLPIDFVDFWERKEYVEGMGSIWYSGVVILKRGSA